MLAVPSVGLPEGLSSSSTISPSPWVFGPSDCVAESDDRPVSVEVEGAGSLEVETASKEMSVAS